MGKPYSMDLRERVVAAIEGGESTHQAAARFAIGIATAGAWARLKRSTGDVRPAKQGKPKGGRAGCACGFHSRCACRGARHDA
jgi:transposase